MKDYSKIKALAQSIIECIGDEAEGENPSLPAGEKPDDDSIVDMGKAAPVDLEQEDPEEKKKKKGDERLALLSSTLASKFKK